MYVTYSQISVDMGKRLADLVGDTKKAKKVTYQPTNKDLIGNRITK